MPSTEAATEPVTLDTLMGCKSVDERTAAADDLATALNGNVATVLELVLLMDSASQVAGKAGAPNREASAAAFLALAKLPQGPLRPVIIAKLVPMAFALVGDKERRVAAPAEEGLKALFETLSPFEFSSVLPSLLNTDSKWQALRLQLALLSTMSKSDSPLARQVSKSLHLIVPAIQTLMWHSKPQVKDTAVECMADVAATMTNKDLAPFLPSLVDIVLNPDAVETCLEKLSSTAFVAQVGSDALAVIAPLLLTGLVGHGNSTATKRQSARIIENMAKLVEDPREVAPLVEQLIPALSKAMEQVANPEAREVCTKAFDQLERCKQQALSSKMVSRDTLLGVVTAAAPQADAAVADVVASMAMSLAEAREENKDQWLTALASTPGALGLTDGGAKLIGDLHAATMSEMQVAQMGDVEEDDGHLLCDCDFSLAYGSKILLNNAKLRLRRGARYGLCGQNDCGKTTLMRAISRNQVEGFPDPSTVRTVFVETDIQGELSDMSVLDYIFADPLLRDCGVTRDEMASTLMSVGFETDGPASIDKEVGRLSGGWKMKLALARAMLLKADILLLDEPTNHLDAKNRLWVEAYLMNLEDVTTIMVSHDTGFLDRVCTNILQIDNLKVNMYRGNLSEFVRQVPAAKAYFELQASKLRFKFPPPGPLEGVSSKGKHILKMSNVTFTYPTATKPQLNNVSVRVSLSSRVACVGPNGAGKSTMIKLLTGELLPDEGHGSEVWKHPNCRVAYVAQHAFHHIENHLDMTPNEYIRWRYQYGVDKEELKKSAMQETEEELQRQKEPIVVEIPDAEGNVRREKKAIKDLTNGRRQEKKGRRNEYEVTVMGMPPTFTVWVPELQLAKMGFEKAMREADERVAAMAAQFNRPLSSQFVEQHICDVGLEREFATHTKIRALSGGQKVKVVLAAALWKCPHIIIIDEPTNYLDRESLGALADAIKEFDGGVVIVSHNNEFCKACCPITWVLENHTLNVEGDMEWLAMSERENARQYDEDEELVDALGNTVKRMKKASRQDMKKLKKQIAQRRKQGEEVWTDEELEKLGFDGIEGK